MKDDTSTPTPDGSSPNAFEEGKPGTSPRDKAESRDRGSGPQPWSAREGRVREPVPMLLKRSRALPGNPIVFANQAFLGLSGYRMDEVLGQQPHFMNGPGTDPNDAARFAEAIRADQDDIIETVQYRKNGSRFVATVLISAFKNEEGRTLNHFMSVLDVTRRAQAEDEVADLKTAQALLRDSEERQRFLLSLGDAMRAESSPDDKIAVAARLLGDKLNASRVLFTEYDWTRNVALTFAGWIAEGAEPFVSIQQLEDYEGEVLNDLKEGRLVRVDDIGARIDEPAYAAIASVGVQALLSPPLLIDGKLKFNVSVHQHEPRHWTDDEVALVREASERLWAEVVRARAEQALRESEEKYRSLFQTMGQGYSDIELIRDAQGRVVDYRYLALNPADERLTGLAVADAIGRTARENLPDLEAWWTETFDRIAKAGKPERIEHQVGSLDRRHFGSPEFAVASKLEAFTKFSVDDREALAEATRNVRIVDAVRRDLISEGEKPRYVHLMLDGWACRYKTLPDGKRQIVSLFVPGDFCDLNVYILRYMDHSIGAITRLKVAMITPEEMAAPPHERLRVVALLKRSARSCQILRRLRPSRRCDGCRVAGRGAERSL